MTRAVPVGEVTDTLARRFPVVATAERRGAEYVLLTHDGHKRCSGFQRFGSLADLMRAADWESSGMSTHIHVAGDPRGVRLIPRYVLRRRSRSDRRNKAQRRGTGEGV